MAISKVEFYNGSPAIMIDGKPYPPMAATIRTSKRAGKGLILDREYFKGLGDSGIKIFILICDTEWLKPGALNFIKEELATVQEEVPDAFFLLRICLHPPTWWVEQNRDQLVTCDDGTQLPIHQFTESYEANLPGMYSLCSEKWRQDAGKALADTVDALEKLPGADRIIGYFLAAGGTSEWYYQGLPEYTDSERYSDVSEPFRLEFSKYLREKYGSDEALQREWKNSDASLLKPDIPDPDKRYYVYDMDRDFVRSRSNLYTVDPDPAPPSNGTNIGCFLDADRYQQTADYFRAWHLGTANSVIHFAGILKDKSPDKLVGCFYGAWGCTDFFYFGTAGGVLHILESGVVDFFASPGVYENRQPGGCSAQREMHDSIRLHGAIYFDEADTRTHKELERFKDSMEVFDASDASNLMKRDFARNICEDTYAWWFDQHVGGGRYKAPEIYALIKRQQEIAAAAYELDRRKNTEIALIYDEESLHYVSNETTKEIVEHVRNNELNFAGVPLDFYFHDDLSLENMPDYKLYIFVNTFVLTDSERQAIEKKVKRNGQTALWMYAPGFVNTGCSPKLNSEYISRLTGIRIKQHEGAHSPKFKINGDYHRCVEGMDKGQIYGYCDRRVLCNAVSYADYNSPRLLYPLFYTDDKDAVVAARFLTSRLPALTIKEFGDWTSIYHGARYLRADMLQSIARYAGCHIYCETEDCLYANKNFVSLHARNSGMKVLCFPNQCSPYEVYDNKFYGENTKAISFNMLRGETRMFSLNGCM